MLWHRFRFVVSVSTFLCLASISSNFTIINLTFLCMTEDKNDTITLANGSLRQRYDYSSSEQSAILMTVAAGTIVATFPTTWLFSTFGTRWPFLAASLLSAVSTAFIPWAAATNFFLLLALRFLQGVSYAADFSTIGHVVVSWAPLRETSFWLGFLTVFSIASSVVTNPVSAWFCEQEEFGWRWSFYAHAVACVLLAVIWTLLYRNDPSQHFAVSERELRVIHKDKTTAHINASGHRKTPYLAIIRNPTILCIWFCAFCELTTTLLLITYIPIYFKKVLGYDISTTGFLVSLVSFSQLPFKISFCISSDRVRFISEYKKMIIFNTMSFAVCGGCFVLIGLAPWRELSVALCCLVSISSAANCGSFYKCAAFVARQHASFVIATIQFCKCLALLSVPLLKSLLVHDEEDGPSWTKLFIINGVILILTSQRSRPKRKTNTRKMTGREWRTRSSESRRKRGTKTKFTHIGVTFKNDSESADWALAIILQLPCFTVPLPGSCASLKCSNRISLNKLGCTYGIIDYLCWI